MSRPLSALDGVGRQAEITRRTGLSFDGSRGPHLAGIVEEMLGAQPDPTPGPSPRRPGDEAAFERLCEALTVQESFFFREPARLALIRERVLPRLRERHSPVRAWSAGCARGEEAYTLSMMLTDAGLGSRYQVLGTDLSARAVASARRGTYGRWALRGLSEETVASYFDGDPGGLRVADRFRTKVAFEQHNLLDPLPSGWGDFDLILCRNVLIYFTPDGVRRAAEKLAAALAPGGWLLLGVSDPSLGDVAGLQKFSAPGGAAYRREDAPAATEPEHERTSVRVVVETPPPKSASAAKRAAPLSAPPRPAQQPDLADPVAAAEAALAGGDARSAVSLACRALEAAPQEPSGHLVMIQALAEDGRTQDALDSSERAVDLFPEDPKVRALRAIVLLESGQVDLAAVAARQAAYLDPGSVLAQVVLARAHELRGDATAERRARRNARILGVGGGHP